MKHAYWFRLVLKSIGLVLIVLALSDLLPETLGHLRDLHRERMLTIKGLAFGPSDTKGIFFISAAPAALQLAIGLYLLLGGRWLINCCIPPHHRYCCECGYDLSMSRDSDRCSECGAALAKSSESS